MNKVSACIVTYNNGEKVVKAVKSLLRHTRGVDLSLYIVDNNSTDDTVGLLRESFPEINIIEAGENKGFGAGHNRVLPLLDSKYHAIVNPDIIIDDDVLFKMSEYLEEHEDVGMLSPKVLNPDGSVQLLGKKEPTLLRILANRTGWGFLEKVRRDYTMRDCDLASSFPIEQATGCFMFIRTDLFRELGGFDERFFMYFEDADLTKRVNKVSKVVYYPEACVFHEWERGGAKNSRLLFIQVASMFKFFFKWVFHK